MTALAVFLLSAFLVAGFLAATLGWHSKDRGCLLLGAVLSGWAVAGWLWLAVLTATFGVKL